MFKAENTPDSQAVFCTPLAGFSAVWTSFCRKISKGAPVTNSAFRHGDGIGKHHQMWVSINGGYPKMVGWYVDCFIKIDDLGVSSFQETTILYTWLFENMHAVLLDTLLVLHYIYIHTTLHCVIITIALPHTMLYTIYIIIPMIITVRSTLHCVITTILPSGYST